MVVNRGNDVRDVTVSSDLMTNLLLEDPNVEIVVLLPKLHQSTNKRLST